jgi:hypothetical protein
MNSLSSSSLMAQAASVIMRNALEHVVRIKQRYVLECRDANGCLKWTEEFDNLVTTEGKNKYLDATLKTGLASPVWYVGLKGTGDPAAGDTLASHATWLEITPYSGNRPAFTPGSVANGSVDNSASKAVFTINAPLTVYGSFLCSAASGTSGTLLGAGNFTTERAVISGDTLSVTITCAML